MTNLSAENIVRSPEWTLRVSSYLGAPGARHYYGRVSRNVYAPAGDGAWWVDKDEFEVLRTLDVAGAKDLSTDDFTWEAGDTTTRFDTREDLLAVAVEQWRTVAADDDWLVYDDPMADDDPLLAGTRRDWDRPDGPRRVGFGNPLRDVVRTRLLP